MSAVVRQPDVVRAAARVAGVPVPDLKSSREHHHTWVRQAAAWVMRTHCAGPPSYRIIAERLGRKDHATMMHAMARVTTAPDRYEPLVAAIMRELARSH